MPIAELEFNAERHEYRLNGRTLPSVTQIISAVLPGWQADPWYMQKGAALHHGCRLLDEGTLDWDSVSPEIEPRIRAWAKFTSDFNAKVAFSEQRFSRADIQFAGTPDRILTQDDKFIVCDLKSTIEPRVRPQLGGYSLLLRPDAVLTVDYAVAVQLQDDGQYRTLWLDKHELRRAEQVFLACLTVHGFMASHKLLKGASNGDGN